MMCENEKIISFFKSEYDSAKAESRYYAEQINKQETFFNIYFAIFSIALGIIYKIVMINNEDVPFNCIELQGYQKKMVWMICLLLSLFGTYLFATMSGNSYYLMIFGEKVSVLEKILNYYLGENIFVWESCFMSNIQSRKNVIKTGCIKINYLKMVFAILIYLLVQTILLFVVYYTVKVVVIYIIFVGCVSVVAWGNWILMWWRVPKYCKNQLEHMYKEKLEIEF